MLWVKARLCCGKESRGSEAGSSPCPGELEEQPGIEKGRRAVAHRVRMMNGSLHQLLSSPGMSLHPSPPLIACGSKVAGAEGGSRMRTLLWMWAALQQPWVLLGLFQGVALGLGAPSTS